MHNTHLSAVSVGIQYLTTTDGHRCGRSCVVSCLFLSFFVNAPPFFFLASPFVMGIFVALLPGIRPMLPASGSTVSNTGLPGKSVFGTFVKHLVPSLGFSDGSVGKEFACNAGDPGSIPWLERSAGEEIGCPLQDFGASFNGSAGKESACSAGDLGLIPGLGRSPGEGKGYPLQYSGLENSMDCIVCGVAKSWTQLSDFHSLTSLS